MSDEILARTRAIVERVAGPDRAPASITRDTRLADGFWLDSVQLLEVIVECEAEFGIVFSEDGELEVSSLRTLGTLADLIASRLPAQA